ncbi:MAG: alpha/beta hydrolase [Nevskia sp.]|nr:alpha/beta hydrolase [Nevskia sp.]
MPNAIMRDGAALHYLSFGRGPDTCVLLHGFAMRAAMWVPLVAPLARRVRFVIPDLRGFGGSHTLPLARSSILDQHADDLHDLLLALDLDDVYLGGLSMGACTALQYQRHYGFDRVRAYLHMDQAPCVLNGADWRHGVLGEAQEDQFAIWLHLMEALENEGRHKPYRELPRVLRKALWRALAQFTEFAFHRRGFVGVAGLSRHELLMRYVAPTENWPIYLDCLRSYMEDDYDWRPSLPRLRVPMTVLIGMQSRIYPAAGQYRIAQYVPHARLVPIDGCGHVVPFEAPLRFLRELERFLAPVPALPRTHVAGQLAA